MILMARFLPGSSPFRFENEERKKQLDAGFGKLKDLKARMANAHAVATDILCLCQKDPKWEWVSDQRELAEGAL